MSIAGLVIALAGCGRAAGALPEITFTERAAHCELRAEGCRWASSGEDKTGLRCRVSLGRETWVKAMIWTAYDDRGQEVMQGGQGGEPWKKKGESREVVFEFGASARDRIARIEVDVL